MKAQHALTPEKAFVICALTFEEQTVNSCSTFSCLTVRLDNGIKDDISHKRGRGLNQQSMTNKPAF